MDGTLANVPLLQTGSQEFFRTITEFVPALVYVCKHDPCHTLLFVNARAPLITGYSAETMLSEDFCFTDLIHEEDRPMVRETMAESIKHGRWYTLRYRFKHASGEWVWFKEIGTVLKDEQPVVLEGYIENITPAELQLKRLLSHEAYLNNLLESSSDLVVCSLDTSLNYMRFNKKHKVLMRALHGVDIEEGLHALDILKDKKAKREAKANYDRVLRGENLIVIEKFKDEDIGTRYWENNLTPLRNEQGEIIGLTMFSRDVSQEKLQEEEIAHSEVLLRSIADNVSEAMLRYSPTHGFVFANESFFKMFRIVNRKMIYGDFDYQQILSNPGEIAFINERIQSGGQITNYPLATRLPICLH